MGDDFDDVEAMLEAPFRKGTDYEVRECHFGRDICVCVIK